MMLANTNLILVVVLIILILVICLMVYYSSDEIPEVGGVADGEKCWSDDMCSSGICVRDSNGLIGKCKTKSLTFKPTYGECTSNAECTSGACTSMNGGVGVCAR